MPFFAPATKNVDTLSMALLLCAAGYGLYRLIKHWRAGASSSLAMRQAEYLIGHRGLWEEELPSDRNEYLMIDPEVFDRMTALFSRSQHRS